MQRWTQIREQREVIQGEGLSGEGRETRQGLSCQEEEVRRCVMVKMPWILFLDEELVFTSEEHYTEDGVVLKEGDRFAEVQNRIVKLHPISDEDLKKINVPRET
jgi:hypothetical protein